MRTKEFVHVADVRYSRELVAMTSQTCRRWWWWWWWRLALFLRFAIRRSCVSHVHLSFHAGSIILRHSLYCRDFPWIDQLVRWFLVAHFQFSRLASVTDPLPQQFNIQCTYALTIYQLPPTHSPCRILQVFHSPFPWLPYHVPKSNTRIDFLVIFTTPRINSNRSSHFSRRV